VKEDRDEEDRSPGWQYAPTLGWCILVYVVVASSRGDDAEAVSDLVYSIWPVAHLGLLHSHGQAHQRES